MSSKPALASREPGAPATGSGIPLCVPEIGGNEWAYIKECLDTGWVSSVGSYVDRFERELAARLGSAHAVATVSGTAALHVALRVAGVESGDAVLLSTLTFIAPANAIRYLGAHPIFVDAEPDYFQMDVAKLAAFLEQECALGDAGLVDKASGRRIRAIVPVHVLGHPVDMDPLLELARRYRLVVVEDATESLGATYRGRAVGTLGALGTFSFNGNKLLTTGGGGMIVTDDPESARRCRYLTTQAKDNPVEFVHGEIGYNYRLTNIQAAMGCAQLERLDDFLAIKRRIAGEYQRRLADVGIPPMREASWARSAFWLYTTRIPPTCGLESRALMATLDELGIQTRPLWQPMHLSPAHRGSRQTACETAERLNREALSLPCSSGLTDEQQARVIDAIVATASRR